MNKMKKIDIKKQFINHNDHFEKKIKIKINT